MAWLSSRNFPREISATAPKTSFSLFHCVSCACRREGMWGRGDFDPKLQGQKLERFVG